MKKYLVFLLIITLLLLSGCSNENKIDNPKQQDSQNITENPNEKIGTKEEWEVVEKTDIIEKEKINIKRDLSEMADYGKLPICYNEAYDAIYYINFSDNNFIYRCKDNEVKLAVRISADNLYTKDGDLYFRVTETSKESQDIEEGNICRYSPITGVVEKLVGDVNTVWMTVSSEGIYYNVEEEKEIVLDGKTYCAKAANSFYYDFEKMTAEEIKAYSSLLIWKDNSSVVPYSPNMVEGSGEGITGLGIHKIGTDLSEVTPLILGGRYGSYCIQEDTLYCTGADGFNMVQLDTGEIKKYAYQMLTNGTSNGLGDFMVHNERVYQQHLAYFIDLKTGESCPLAGSGGESISRLFSVNNKLYGIYYEKGYNNLYPIGTPEIVEVVVGEETIMTPEGEEALCYKLKRIGEE